MVTGWEGERGGGPPRHPSRWHFNDCQISSPVQTHLLSLCMNESIWGSHHPAHGRAPSHIHDRETVWKWDTRSWNGLGWGDGFTSLAGRTDVYLIAVCSVSLGKRKWTSDCFLYSRHTFFLNLMPHGAYIDGIDPRVAPTNLSLCEMCSIKSLGNTAV